MKKFREFMTEAKSYREGFKEMLMKVGDEQLVKRVFKQIDNRPKGAAAEILDYMPVNREKLWDEMKKKRNIDPYSEEATDFVIHTLSKKSGWKRFGLKTLDLG